MVTPGLLGIRVRQTTEEGIHVRQSTEEAIRVHRMMKGTVQDRFHRGIGGVRTQGQAQDPAMSREAGARVPDTQGDLLCPKNVKMEMGFGFTLCELVMYDLSMCDLGLETGLEEQ